MSVLERARGLSLRLLRNREAQVVTGFSLANAALGVLANRVLTQLVAPRPLGELYLLLNLALWLTVPSSAAFLYVQRNWATAKAQGVPRWFAAQVVRFLGAQGGLALLALLAAGALGLLPSGGPVALALLAAACAQAVLQLVTQLAALERRRVAAGVLDLLAQPGRLVFLGVGAHLLLGAAASGVHLLELHAVWTVALAGLVLWLAVRLVRAAAPEPDRGAPGPALSLPAALHFCLPFLGTTLAIQIGTSAERWGLARLADPAATALFVQATGLSLAAAGAATSFLGAYFYPLIHAAGAGERPLEGARVPLRRYLLLSALASAAMVACGVPFAGPAARLLFGPRFAQVESLLPWTLAAAAAFVLGQAIAMVSVVARDAKGPNLARSLPLALYVVALLAWPRSAEPALLFSRLYLAQQLLYLAASAAAALRAVARARRQEA
jgi:hypothetical protein